MEKNNNYYVYILRCNDDSLYTGIARDVEKRYEEHLVGRGAKYTKARGVRNIEIAFLCNGRSDASRIEFFIKKQNKKWKEYIIREFPILEEIIKKELGIKIKKNIDSL